MGPNRSHAQGQVPLPQRGASCLTALCTETPESQTGFPLLPILRAKTQTRRQNNLGGNDNKWAAFQTTRRPDGPGGLRKDTFRKSAFDGSLRAAELLFPQRI